MSSEILFLKDWNTSFLERIWIYIKIFIKEGLWHQQWDLVFRLGGRHGSLKITEGLTEGLSRKGISLLTPRDFNGKAAHAVVFRDVRNLKWAIEEKRAGRISKILAGPFVATMPFEYNAILEDPHIDGLIFLSQWHHDLFGKYASKPVPQRHIWFSGVDHNRWRSREQIPRDRILLFVKQASEHEISEVELELKRRRLNYSVIRYGSYTPEEYFNELERAQFVIFLHRSETQGLATFEAWSMNRPTLHFNPGEMKFLGTTYKGASSCPYLSPATGLDFRTWSEFKPRLDRMLEIWPQLQPRQEILEKFTWDKSVERFCEILERS